MKKIAWLTALVLFLWIPTSSMAVEKGTDASGSSFVVPVWIQYDGTTGDSCSGALISTNIVVTAGHCVLDSTGLISKRILVGAPGSIDSPSSNWDAVSSVQITSTYQTPINSTVGSDDLAFLVLTNPLTFSTPIRLASEAEIQALKASQSKLQLLGYGYIDNAGTLATTPNSFVASFSQIPVNGLVDSAFASSIASAACQGDSGGPVLSITPNEVVLIGVIVGTAIAPSNHCGSLQPGGNYLTSFTLISRYANLAFAAASSALTSITSKNTQSLSDLQSKISQLQAQITSMESDASDTQSANDATVTDLQSQIEQLQATVTNLTSRLPKNVTCVKGKLTKKITGLNAKCPIGYSVKA